MCFRDLEVQRVDRKVVEVMTQYGDMCGRARQELKGILSARERELSHQRQLDRLTQRTPHNRHQIVSFILLHSFLTSVDQLFKIFSSVGRAICHWRTFCALKRLHVFDK